MTLCKSTLCSLASELMQAASGWRQGFSLELGGHSGPFVALSIPG